MSQCSIPSLQMLNTEQAETAQRQGSWDAPPEHVHLVKTLPFLPPPPQTVWQQCNKVKSRCLLKGRSQQQAHQFPCPQ